MTRHGFTRRPRSMRGNIRGGMAVGCTGCSWMTVMPLSTAVPVMLKAHHDHIARATEDVASTAVAPAQLVDVRTELADLGARLEAVTASG